MSILLVGLAKDVIAPTITRLVAQDDEVRVITPDGAEAEAARKLGAHVALGPFDDVDLIERACHNVRTLVFGDIALEPDNGEALVNGAVRAGVGRWIYCSEAPRQPIVDEIKSTGSDYVVLATPRQGLLRRPFDPGEIAEAVDAADDMVGHPELELNLKDPVAWQALKVFSRRNRPPGPTGRGLG
ncbi:MAG: NmrA-like family [Actinomycetota bacterium]|nr:NmrA-like family [Actinomycetota bacterium]